MKRIARISLALAALAVPSLVQASDIEQFVPAEIGEPKKFEKIAKGVFDAENFEEIQKRAPKKVAVTEFTVEFVTRWKKGYDAGGWAGIKNSSQSLGEDTLRKLANGMYEQFVAAMAAKGITALPKADVAAHELYLALAGPTGLHVRETMVGPNHPDVGVSTELACMPADGLKVLPRSGDDEETNEETEARLLEALGADATIRVRVIVALYKSKYPSIEAFTNLKINAGIDKKTHKKTGKVEYGFVDWNDADVEHGFYIESDIGAEGEKKDFKFDGEKYVGAILTMNEAFSKMMVRAFVK